MNKALHKNNFGSAVNKLWEKNKEPFICFELSLIKINITQNTIKTKFMLEINLINKLVIIINILKLCKNIMYFTKVKKYWKNLEEWKYKYFQKFITEQKYNNLLSVFW